MIPFMGYLITQAHPWFKGVPWDKLYDMEAAFKPEVNGELDTQNFEKFEEVYFVTTLYSSSSSCSLLAAVSSCL